MFWICALGLFHGLRANEIASLRTTDIIWDFNTTCIDLKLPKELPEGVRRGKSKTNPLKLPMHPTLITLDFPKFAASQPTGRIFHQLPRSADGYCSRKVSDWGTASLEALGWKNKKLSYHSFRHTFFDALDEAGIPEKWKAYLGGWRLKGVMNKTYGSKEMKESIVPSLANVRRADRWLSSTSRMISNFSDAAYLIRGRPHRLSCFFEKAQLKRLLCNNLLQIAGFTAQVFDLIGVCNTRCVTCQPPLASFHEVLGPFVIDPL